MKTDAVGKLNVTQALIFLIGTAWLILYEFGVESKWVLAVKPYLSGWLLAVNLSLCPVLGALCAMPIRLPNVGRILALVLFLFSTSLLAVSRQTFPTATSVVIAAMLVEMFVVIPAWKEYLSPDPSRRDRPFSGLSQNSDK